LRPADVLSRNIINFDPSQFPEASNYFLVSASEWIRIFLQAVGLFLKSSQWACGFVSAALRQFTNFPFLSCLAVHCLYLQIKQVVAMEKYRFISNKLLIPIRF
jgi:hypothetical protein